MSLAITLLSVALAAACLVSLFQAVEGRRVRREYVAHLARLEHVHATRLEVIGRSHARELVAVRVAAVRERERGRLGPCVVSTAVVEVISAATAVARAEEVERHRRERCEVDPPCEIPSSGGPDTVRSSQGVGPGRGDE